MKSLTSSRQARLIAFALVLVCAGFIGTKAWRAFALKNPSQAASPTEIKTNFHSRLSRGIGNEVKFASQKDSDEKVKESVESADNFIYLRSGLKMSDETKDRLIKAEKNVLKGKGHRLSAAELTDTLTDAVTERVATLTDAEIDNAAKTFRATPEGEISSRANGEWGFLTREDFVQQAKAAREWSRNGDKALRDAMRPMVAHEVNKRLADLSEALPGQFGNSADAGVTPTQAVIVAYSIAADDPLSDSQADFRMIKAQQNMALKRTRAAEKAQKQDSGRPYGPNGFVFSTPANLVLSKKAVDKLIDRAEGGNK